MVSNEVVLQTVKRMISTGVDDNTIRMTLKGIKLPDSEIDALINEAKGISRGSAAEAPVRAEAEDSVKDEDAGGEYSGEGDEDFGEDAGDDEGIRDDMRDSHEQQLAHHTTTHNILEEHAGRMEELRRGVSGLHEKIDSTPRISGEEIAKLSALDTRISALEREIGETKANTIALQDLLKKILETNRKTLIELQKK